MKSEKHTVEKFKRYEHERIRLCFVLLVPIVYATILSPSISPSCFWADDGATFVFIRNIPSFWRLIGCDSFQYFRPVKNLLWFGFSKLSPFGLEWCHLVAISIGASSFFPVLALCRRILDSEWKGLAAATVWLFSPTLVSSAAWLSCVNIRIMVAFAALAIACHDKAWDSGTIRPSWVSMATLFLFLALVCYECAIAVIPILLLFDLFLRPERIRMRSCQIAHACYWTITLLYLWLRFIASGKERAGRWVEAERWQLIFSSPWFSAQHFSNWFWPFNRFTVLGSYCWGDVPAWILAASAVLGIGVLLFALFCRKRHPVLSFCILFAAVGFAPVSNCLGFGNGPYGDYYLTLASIGIAAGCVETCCLLARTAGHCGLVAAVLVAAFSSIRVAAIFEAVRWARFWGRGELAFEESVRNYPKFYSNKFAFVQFLSDEGRYEEAFKLAQELESRMDSNSRKMSVVHLVRALYAINVSRDADEAFRRIRLCERRPDFNITTNLCNYYRGCVFEDLLDNPAAAEQKYVSALGSHWGFELVPCADRLARLYAIRGDRDRAIALWERAEETDSDNVPVLWNLAVAYREAGEMEKAGGMWHRVQKLTGKEKVRRPPLSP